MHCEFSATSFLESKNLVEQDHRKKARGGVDESTGVASELRHACDDSLCEP